MSQLTSHQQVIDLWPSQEAFCSDIDQPYARTNKWYIRNSIPAHHWVAVVNAAHQHDFPVTYKLLAEIIADDKKNPLTSNRKRVACG